MQRGCQQFWKDLRKLAGWETKWSIRLKGSEDLCTRMKKYSQLMSIGRVWTKDMATWSRTDILHRIQGDGKVMVSGTKLSPPDGTLLHVHSGSRGSPSPTFSVPSDPETLAVIAVALLHSLLLSAGNFPRDELDTGWSGPVVSPVKDGQTTGNACSIPSSNDRCDTSCGRSWPTDLLVPDRPLMPRKLHDRVCPGPLCVM